MEILRNIYVIYDYEGDIVCACETKAQADEIIAEEDKGMLFSIMVILYGNE